ncbi:MAG: xylulokinase [Clostridiales bacterium]|jgi:xylulokinase|nr:xylulokinase [Clostridiales bacterium]
MKYLIGIDIGTSGTKTVLFDQFGEIVASSLFGYELIQPRNGWAEQDPLQWWNATVLGIRDALNQSKINPQDIAGIGLSGQMHGLVMLDSSKNLLRNSIIWCDGRSDLQAKKIAEKCGDKIIEITANPAMPAFTAAKLLWVKDNEPDIYSQCAHILLPKDYIRFKLTGVLATEVSDASGMQLLDVPKRTWSGELCEILRIDAKILPEVYESSYISGYVNAQAAEETGLYKGTPVAGGAGDQAASAVGNGIIEQGKVSDTLGSSGVVFAHTQEPLIDKLGRVHTFCHAVEGQWHVMGVTQGAGLSLKWFKDNFYQAEAKQAAEQNLNIYDIIMDQVQKIKIGADNLIFLPYLMGERTPHLDTNARGVFFGISAIHTKAHFARAVVEGITYSQRDCLNILIDMGVKPEYIVAGGGGAKSAYWRQMLADNFKRDVYTLQQDAGGCLGAAILSGVGTGLYRDVKTACESILKLENKTTPDMAASQIYDQYYQVYQSLYGDLKHRFKILSEVV